MDKRKNSKITKLYIFKLIYRLTLFLVATILYIFHRINSNVNISKASSYLLIVIGIVFVIEMLFRLIPNKLTSIGCQKHYSRNYSQSEETPQDYKSKTGILGVILLWILALVIFGVLFFTKIIDEAVLILCTLALSVLDVIFILVYCPFQSWFMKNKCCGTCRIHNWDYAMIFTPLIFVMSPVTIILVIFAIVILIQWEIVYHRHPERFSETTNVNLSCKNCNEHLCVYKKKMKCYLESKTHKQHNSNTQNK